ncbi:MAG: hypothetical protein PWR01_680 [Clostridiales bacterium]|jgi:hypothetical protein|nr:hypothetical protein [Clostridiales bacterium]
MRFYVTTVMHMGIKLVLMFLIYIDFNRNLTERGNV